MNVVGGWNLEDSRYNRFYMQRTGMLVPEMHDSFELFDGEYKSEQNDSSYGIIGFFETVRFLPFFTSETSSVGTLTSRI